MKMKGQMKSEDAWDWESTLKLVKSLKQHPGLYDTTCEEYQSKSQTDKSWEAVAKATGQTVDDCKNKWKNIRNSYSRNLRMRINRNKTKPYYLEDHVKFIKKFLTFRLSTGTHQQADFANSSVNGVDDDEDDDNPVKPEVQYSDDDMVDSDGQSSYKQERPAKRSRMTLEDFSFVNAEDGTNEYQNLTTDDPDMAFLRSVLPDMQAMDQNMKRKFKIKVLKLCEELLCDESL